MDQNSSMSLAKSDLVLLVRRRLSNGLCGVVLVALTAMLGLSGCCTHLGPGCHAGNCYDCDGTNQYIPMSPFQHLRHRMTCSGGGCGEVYVGEWISTPPDCHDPCCDDQFVGGAAPCRPGCWSLCSLFDLRRFSVRYDSGGCCDGGCFDSGCDHCGGGEYFEGESYFEGEAIEAPVYQSGSAGCSTCSSRTMVGRTQFAAVKPSNSSRPDEQLQGMNNPTPRSMRTAAPRPSNAVRQASLPPRQSGSVRPAGYAKPVNTAPRTGNGRNRIADQYDQYDQYDQEDATFRR
jgi:hypothetical protein